MPLMPDDIVRRTFGKARLRGYDTVDVDTFMEEIVEELRRVHQELDRALAVQQAGQSETGGRDRSLTVLEREELDAIRRERAALVADMAQLQERYDRLKRAADELESRTATGGTVRAENEATTEPTS